MLIPAPCTAIHTCLDATNRVIKSSMMDIFSCVSMVSFPPVNPPAKNWKPCRCPISGMPAHQWQWECDSYASRSGDGDKVYHSSTCGGSYIINGRAETWYFRGQKHLLTEDVRRLLKEWIKEERSKGTECPIITTEVVESQFRVICRDWLCQHQTDDPEQDEQAFAQECFPTGRWSLADDGTYTKASMPWFQEEWQRSKRKPPSP